MKFLIALRRRVTHITKKEKYVPPERAFLEECGDEHRDAYRAFKHLTFRYSLWAVPIGIALALAFGLPMLGLYVAIFAFTFAYAIGTWGLFGLPIMAPLLGLTMPFVFVIAATIEVGVAAVTDRVPRAARARAAYREFMWSHRRLIAAVVKYNRAHPPVEPICG